MRVVPRNLAEQIQFAELHAQKWSECYEQIGTTAEAVAELASRAAAAKQAFKKQLALKNAARSATQDYHDKLEAMNTLLSAIISQVRARAMMAGNAIYPLASLPVPEKGSPIAAPGQPYGFTAELQQVGPLVLRWKCKNPRGAVGTTYHVWRRIGINGKPEFLGVTGQKKFVDVTVPPGTATVTYEVQGVRSTRKGRWGNYSVNFAVEPGSPVAMQHPGPGPRAGSGAGVGMSVSVTPAAA